MYILTLTKQATFKKIQQPFSCRVVMGCEEWATQLLPIIKNDLGYQVSVERTDTMPERSPFELKAANRIVKNAFEIFQMRG